MANRNSDETAIYQIRIQGRLGPQWADWFGGLQIAPADNGETLLTGPVVDQAALHGILRLVRDLGLPLLAVTRLHPAPDDNAAGTTLDHNSQEA